MVALAFLCFGFDQIEVYCPKCNSINVEISCPSDEPNIVRISIDELPIYDSNDVKTLELRMETCTATCKSCGYTRNYMQVVN